MVQEGMVVRAEARDYGNNDSRGDEHDSWRPSGSPSDSKPTTEPSNPLLKLTRAKPIWLHSAPLGCTHSSSKFLALH